MITLRLSYRLEKELKWGEDENGEPCEAYVQVKQEIKKEVSEEGYNKLHEAFRKIIANEMDVDFNYITPISLDEYSDNTDEE